MEERNLKLVADNNPRKRHLLLLLVALVVIIGLGIYFLLTDFSIQKVEIKGNDTYTNTEILDAMKEDGYVNNTLLMIAQNQIFGQTYLPFIDKISMSYDDSHILKVRVKEKLRAGVFQYMNQYVYFNENGIAMESRNTLFNGVPVVTGVKFNEMKLKKKILENKVPVKESYFNTIVSITKKIATYKLTVSEIHFEGEDDISYLKSMNEVLRKVGSGKCIDFSKVSFWYIRGKDDLKLKVMANKQLLSQAVPNCKYAAIFDKDFSTVEANNRFIDNEVKRRLGNGAWVHTHNGYCIESVLFSDKDKLKKFLIKLAGDGYQESIREYVDYFYQEAKEKLESVRSDMYCTMKNKFASQKKTTRPELENVEFDSYAAEASENIQFAMLKDNIKSFVMGLETLIGRQIIERADDECETVAAGMLNTYLNKVEFISDMYEDYLDMFTKIKAFIM